MNERLHLHKKASSSGSAPVLIQFQSRPNTTHAQPHSLKPLTQTEIENQEFQHRKLDATRLEIQAKYGSITPLGQERLTVLQASTSDLLQRRLEHASRFGHSLAKIAKIAINRPDAPLPQSIRPKVTSGKPEELDQETFIDQRFRASLQIQPWSMGGSLPIREPLVQPKLTIGQPGDKYEQEADRVGSQVVNQINTPAPQQSGQSQPVQREAIPEEEDELMMKPLISTIQREQVPEEEEELQMKPSGSGMTTTPDLEASIQQARGSGQSLADNIRAPMEQAFGADFSGVKVHSDAQSDQLNQSIQARAFTTGQDIFFRQGEYNPGSRAGQELIAHEFTHVVQQSGEEVQRVQQQATKQALADKVELNKILQTKQNELPLYYFSKKNNKNDVYKQAVASTESNTITQIQTEVNESLNIVQRTVEWKYSNYPNNTLNNFADALNGLVQAGARLALETPNSLPGNDGYTKLWKDTAPILIAIRDGYLNVNDSDESKAANSFGAARYGYAIEAYASSQEAQLNGALPAGYSFQLQASRGMTRPDIIVFNNLGQEVGWFDVTSAGSLGHIDKKTGSGWQTKTYVAEITYPVMDIANLGTGNMTIGQGVALRNAYRRRKELWNKLVNDKKAHFISRWESSIKAEQISNSKQNRRENVISVLKIVFSETEIKPQIAKSLLRSFGLSIKFFGFERGGTKSEGDKILRQYQNQ